MGNILAIGMSNTDFVCRTPKLPVAGETVAGTSFETFAGGKGANQAVAAARCGSTVWFGGAIGDDEHGRARRGDLVSEGIGVSLLQELPNMASGIAFIVVDDAGNNQIVTVAGANDRVDAGTLVESLSTVEYDLALLTWELVPSTTRHILAGLDPQVPVALTIAPFDTSVFDVLADERLIVVANRIEASQLLGRQVTKEDALAAVRDIQLLGCRAAVVTLGKDGAVWAHAEGFGTVAAAAVDVVDTTGAGDAFSGAFGAWLAEGATIQESTKAGVHAGCISVTRAGAQSSLPTRDEIMASMLTASR